MKNILTFLLSFVSFLIFAQQKNTMTTSEVHQMMEDLYKEVKYNTKEDQVLYSLNVFNGACNYKI